MSRTPIVLAVTSHMAAFALCLCVVNQARADYEPHKYTEPGTGLVLEYNLYVPAGYDSAQKYPLLVFLHAAGQPDDLPRSLSSSGKGWTGSFIDNGDDQKYPSFFLVPISQTNSSGWGDGRSDAEKFEGRLTIVVLKELLASGQYNIDADRLYVTGPSMGGRGAWDMIEKQPGLFAAAVPAAAPGLDDAAKVIGENIWAINGENDSTVEDNRDAIAAIRALGGNPIYTELAGHGHDTWRDIYPSDAFMTWVYAQRRGVPWWNVSQVPEVPDPLTPGQPAVTGPTEPTGGSGGMGGIPGGASAGGAAAGQPTVMAGAGGTAGAAPTTGGFGNGLAGTTASMAGQPSAIDPSGAGSGSILASPGGSEVACSYAPAHRQSSPLSWLPFLFLAAVLRRRAR